MPATTHSYNNDKQTVVLSIELPKSEYLPTIDKKLKDYRKKVQMKGFRQGQVPMGLMRSKFGNAILFEELNEMIDKSVQEFIKAENLKILGNPMPMSPLKASIQRPVDVKIDVEIGFVPEFEVAGISNEKVMPYYEVTISDEKLDEEIENLRKQRSFDFEEGVTDITETDMLSVSITELEGDQPREEGGFNESTFIVMDKVSEALKSTLLSATVGDKITTTLNELDSSLSPEKARKYFYKLTTRQTCNDECEIEILSVRRVKLKELDADFFKEIYQNEEEPIETLEAFREKFREDVQAQFEQPSNNIYYRAIYEELIAQNDMPLPSEFLRLWLSESGEAKREVSEEELEGFLTRLRWSLILDKLSDERNIEVTQEDIEQRIRMAIARYYNFQIPPNHPMLDPQVKEMMENRDTVRQYAEQILEDKVLTAIGSDFSKDIQTVTETEFDEIYNGIFKENQVEEQTEANEEVVETEDNAEVAE